MLKGKDTPNAEAPGRPRKKLSFREPEIVGHMKQEIRKRFALASSSTSSSGQQHHQNQPPQQPLVLESNNNNRVFGRAATFRPMGDIGEDPELEVHVVRRPTKMPLHAHLIFGDN